MGGGSSVNSHERKENSVTFSDEEIQELMKEFFDFYNHAAVESKGEPTNCWNFDLFEKISSDMSVQQSVGMNIEHKIRTEYFRSLSTIHPLRVHQHIFEYISSGILDIRDSDQYAELMSIVTRDKDLIQSLITAAESIRSVEFIETYFDVDYDDGKQEMKMPIDMVRLQEGDNRLSCNYDLVVGS